MQTQNDTRKSSTFVARHDATQKKKGYRQCASVEEKPERLFPGFTLREFLSPITSPIISSQPKAQALFSSEQPPRGLHRA